MLPCWWVSDPCFPIPLAFSKKAQAEEYYILMKSLKKKKKKKHKTNQPKERGSHLLLFLIASSPLPIFYLWVPLS